MRQIRKLVTMLVSLTAAILLWLYVVTAVAPEVSFRISSIPINIDGGLVLEDRGLIITEQSDKTLWLEVKTSRSNLLKLNQNTVRANVDVSKIREPGEHVLSCDVTFPDTVRSGDVEILRKSEDGVKVEVFELKRKSVPVEVNCISSVENGYWLDSANVLSEPAEILISGPDYEVDKIRRAVVSYNVSGLEETKIEKNLKVFFFDDQEQEMEFSKFTSANTSAVTLTIPVYPTKELKLEVQLQAGGGISESNADVKIEPASIMVSGKTHLIEKLQGSLILNEKPIDLATIPDHYDTTLPLDLEQFDIIPINGETEARIIIDLKGIRSDTLPVSDIRLLNKPENYQVEYLPSTVNVKVRGSAEEIDALKQNQSKGIYIELDLKDYAQIGKFSVPGKIVTSDRLTISIQSTVEFEVVISAEEQGGSTEE